MFCLIAIMAFFGPRVAGFVWWLFRPGYFSTVFDTIIWPVVGFVFVPWTTLMYLMVYPGGIGGLDWLWLGIALAIDIASYGSVYGNKNKIPGMNA